MSCRILVALSLFACVLHAQEQVPFPTRKSTILRKERVVYYVEGRQKIPWGCEISCQKDVHVVARGSNAVLEVAGSLQAHGVSTREIIFEGVTIEPAPRCEDIHLDMVIFRKGGGLKTPKGKPVHAKIFVENTEFNDSSALDIELTKGRVDLSATESYGPVRVTGVAEEGRRSSNLVLMVRGCRFDQGLFVTGARDATIRINHLRGDRSEFVDCHELTFDGNKVNSEVLLFRQTKSGRFSKTKLQKCDIYSNSVRFEAPVGKSKEKVSLDKCFFKGFTRKKEILAAVIHDARNNEKSGVMAVFRKVNKRPLELAGALER